MQDLSLDQEDPRGKEMTTHFSILAWRIPRTEETGRLQPKGSQSPTRLSTLLYPQLKLQELGRGQPSVGAPKVIAAA